VATLEKPYSIILQRIRFPEKSGILRLLGSRRAGEYGGSRPRLATGSPEGLLRVYLSGVARDGEAKEGAPSAGGGRESQ
jgi:hypothetical protein